MYTANEDEEIFQLHTSRILSHLILHILNQPQSDYRMKGREPNMPVELLLTYPGSLAR